MLEITIICANLFCSIHSIDYNPDITIAEGIYRVFEINDEIIDELGDDFPDNDMRL